MDTTTVPHDKPGGNQGSPNSSTAMCPKDKKQLYPRVRMKFFTLAVILTVR
ncbi:MAG: hypothetical protein IPK58_13170 [Acidobacteria bacterium]|nr:hypothetical protein [Acidobacteriota bacterium]